ncbi:MAG: hypothetical protein WCC64_04595 [Aliidongia sp.]
MNRKQRFAHALRHARSWLVPTHKLGPGEADARVATAWCDGYEAGVRAERKKLRKAVAVAFDDGVLAATIQPDFTKPMPRVERDPAEFYNPDEV